MAEDAPSPTAYDITHSTAELRMTAGPLPDADQMHRYAQVQSDLPERITVMAERQLNHRIEVERAAVDAEIADRRSERWETRLGQMLGFVIALTGILGGVYVTATATQWTGHAGGVAISGATLYGIVRALVIGKKIDQAKQAPVGGDAG